MSAVKSFFSAALGQGLAALGIVLGQRWLTGMVSPQVFGEVALLVGIAGLAVNVFSTPLVQAALHAYPLRREQGGIDSLNGTLMYMLAGKLGWAAAALACGGVIAAATGIGHVAMLILTTLLFVADSWRTAALAMTNAAEHHFRHAMWTCADAWLRALIAVCVVFAYSGSAAAVMVAYVIAAVALLPLAWKVLPLRPQYTADDSLRRQLGEYALPLLPLGVIGWVTGLADRYVIGGTLSIADAGIYAAAAGLASRPMLMLGTAVELVMRPRYQQAVSSGDVGRAQRLVFIWLAAIASSGLLMVALFGIGHEYVAHWLLGDRFRSGSFLMPYIAAGYWLLVVSYVFERICYAHGSTRRVLAIQASTAFVAVICLMVGTRCYGLVGAAMSVPVYYSMQLLVSILQARLAARGSQFLLRGAHA